MLTGGSTIKGLTINRFTRGIELQGTSNQVVGNYIGTDAAGTAAQGNTSAGVRISGGSGNTIGGSTAADRNIISGNFYGIDVNASSSNQIVGNTIGLNAAGNAAVANTQHGILLNNSPSNTVEKNIVSGNSNYGLMIFASLSVNNIVRSNYFGTDITGSIDLGNTLDGVIIIDASNNTIGGTLTTDRNVISGNNDDGITISETGTGNVVLGNLIGLNAAGNAALPNADDGISVSAPSNIIGGAAVGAGNYISANLGDGIEILNSGLPAATGNQVMGNTIGRDLANTVRGNATFGIYLNGVANTVISAGNMIVGSGDSGIQIIGTGATGNVIKGNLIGTDGTADFGNGRDGINISNSPNNVIGGLLVADRNIISGNSDDGITLGTTATGTLIQGNYIGTNAAGTLAIPNSDDGIVITSNSNIVGGTVAGSGNLISGNGGDGVEIITVSTTPTNNQVLGNVIGLVAMVLPSGPTRLMEYA